MHFKEQVQDFFLEYLLTAYTDEDRALAKLPDTVDGRPVQADEGLYTLDDNLKGLNEDLHEVSDSSSEEESSDDETSEKPPPKWKRAAKSNSTKDRSVTDTNTKNRSATKAKETSTAQPKKSAYELERDVNIAAIANNPLLKEINDDLARMRAEHLGLNKPKPKPKPRLKYPEHVPPIRRSEGVGNRKVQDEATSGVEEPAESSSGMPCREEGETGDSLTSANASTNAPSNEIGDKPAENVEPAMTPVTASRIEAGPISHDAGEDGVHACADAGTPMDVDLAEDATVTDVEREGLPPPKLPEPTNPPASPPIHSQSSPQSPHMALPSNGHASVSKPHSSSLSPSRGDTPSGANKANAEWADEEKIIMGSAPPWFVVAYRVFVAEELRDSFTELLHSYAQLESQLLFIGPQKGLPPTSRPCILSKWVSRGHMRKGNSMPVLTEIKIDDFKTEWSAWWKLMQPDWREESNDGGWERGMYGDDWGSLRVGGPNGWLGVVMCLFWWGTAVGKMENEERAMWAEAVTDARWMIDGLRICVET